MRKLFVSLTVISFLNMIGCYYQEQMNPGKYKFDKKEDIQLTTKDTTYILGGKDYHFENDTLFATVSKKIDKQTSLKTNVEIPAENIRSVEVERTDALASVLIGLGIVVGAFVLAFLISTEFTGDIF